MTPFIMPTSPPSATRGHSHPRVALGKGFIPTRRGVRLTRHWGPLRLEVMLLVIRTSIYY